MQLEEYLQRDDRIVFPLGCTEQHAYLSLGTDNILAERVSLEAAEPLAVPVLPVLPYGFSPGFGAYPGTPTLRLGTLLGVVRDVLDSTYGQGFRRFLIVNGHGGNTAVASLTREWLVEREGASVIFHSWFDGPKFWQAVEAIDGDTSHAGWMENFPWTRLDGVEVPTERKPSLGDQELRANPGRAREVLGDGSFGGLYERSDADVQKIWAAGVAEVRELLESGWPD